MTAAAEVRTSQGSAAMAAWAKRPGDEEFENVQDLLNFTKRLRNRSHVKDSAVEALSIVTHGDSMRPASDAMFVVDREGKQSLLNNYSFNQFCYAIGARAGEYKKVPSVIAQIPLAWLAENAERKDVKLLISTDEDGDNRVCRAINSPSYGRIWNDELAEAVGNHIDPELWTIPDISTFHTKKGFITANDRKVFVFLVNEGNPIEVPGMAKPLYRGFYAWNSEVGDGTCGYADFLYNGACANRAIIGITDFEELNIRHTIGAPDRWMKDAVPKLNEYVNSSTEEIVARVQASRDRTVAKDEKGALAWLKEKKFTQALAKSALDSAREEAHGADIRSSPYSYWNIVQGLTAQARLKANNDDRVDIEKAAGKLMKLVG